MALQFVLAPEPVRYWWPVTVRLPDPENPGAILERKLKVLFQAESQDEAFAHQEGYAKLKTARERLEHERSQLLRVCKDWSDVVDADKRPVEFNEKNFRAALQQSWFRTGVHRAYAESLNSEAQAGN